MAPVSELARVFSDAKTVDSRALNLAGAQPFRAVLARFLFNLRRGSHDPVIAELSHTGLLVCNDFLPPEAFAAARVEALAHMDASVPTWLHHHGTTEVRHYSLSSVDAERFPHLAEWRGHQEVMSLATAAERRPCRRSDSGSLVEHVIVGDDSERDPETELHVDTFFNTHKVWLYLDDVTPENAPLVYVPGSHRLDSVRLRHEYREATSANRESRRVSEDELRSRGLERRVMSCPRNTLVVANTCGYHCRSVGQEVGASRRALHMTFRFNPFSSTRSLSRIKRSATRVARRRTS